MNDKLRDGLIKLINSMPECSTGGSFNWGDGEQTYSVSCSFSSMQWQMWATAYPVPKELFVMDGPVAALPNNVGQLESAR